MTDPLPPDPYKALSIPKDAATDAVKKAFRKLALTCHPDKTKALPESERKAKEEQFHCIKNAHDLLVDDDERRRYDLKVERDSLSRRPTYGPSKSAQANPPPPRPQAAKSTTTPIFSHSRTAPIFEYREPKSASYETKKPSYDDYQRPRYETRRPAPKPTYDDHYYDDVSPASSRRSSGRVPEEKRDRRAEDEKLRRKLDEQRLKEQERKLWEERERKRDRDRRQEAHHKHYARVESESDSDSEVDKFMSSSRRSPERRPRYDDRKSDPRRSNRREEEKARRSRSEESESSDDDRHYAKKGYDRTDERVASAAQYIKKSSGKTIMEKEDRHEKRPAMTRSRTAVKKSPPPPPAPPVPPTETGKRSSGRRVTAPVKSAGKDRKMPSIDIVDPPREDYFNLDERDRRDPRETKKPSSSRATQSPRAQTSSDKVPDKPAGLRRAQTSPLAQMASTGHTPAKSSRLKQTQTQDYDSESSSRSTSPEPAPRYTTKSTSYRYVDPDEDRRGPRTPYVVEISPEHDQSRRRDESPRTKQPFVERERPAASSSRRAPPTRSSTFDHEPSRRANHSASNSGDKKRLFGEVPDIAWAPTYGKADIKYADYGRRGSADDARENGKMKDAHNYMQNVSRAHHPGMGSRNASYAQPEMSYA